MKEPIVIRHIFPPIPCRHFDFEATRGDWEPGVPRGYGQTEEDAIADLLLNETES